MIVVIGAGPAGLAAVRQVSQSGNAVVLMQRHAWGDSFGVIAEKLRGIEVQERSRSLPPCLKTHSLPIFRAHRFGVLKDAQMLFSSIM